MKPIKATNCILHVFVLIASQVVSGEQVLVETHGPIIKGALIDDYNDEALIIKITPPSRMLGDTLMTVDKERTPPNVYANLRKQLGYLEKIYQGQYQDILESFQQMITTPYPIQTSEEKKKFDLTHFTRQKKSPLRALNLMAFLRVIRPVSRVSGKLTKYGKFIKTLKYTGYAASASVFAYEMADIFGAIPDKKYDEYTTQIKILYENRDQDLKIIDKVALITMSLNNHIKDTTSELKNLISEADNSSELKIRGSHLLSNYLSQLTFSIMILIQGKIPTFLMSLETQRNWLEMKINTGLLLYLSTISPHLPVQLKAIDEIQGQLIIKVSVPTPDSRFQLLHYVQWEPKIWMDGKCFSSPSPFFYLAYPSSKASEIIKKPMLIDPRSCLSEGFLMCESDSLLKRIPDLTINEICSTLPLVSRRRRSADNEIIGPYYNLSGIIDRSLVNTETIQNKNTQELIAIREELRNLIAENDKKKQDAVDKLETAAKEQRIYKGLVIGLIASIFMICTIILYFVKKFIRNGSDIKSLKNEMVPLQIRS